MTRHRLYDKYKRNQDSKRFYNSAKWIKARTLALNRDNYLCQECLRNKTITVADVVHHIQHLRDYPELGLTLENLESLCHTCHNKDHSTKDESNKNKRSNRIPVVVMDGSEERV